MNEGGRDAWQVFGQIAGSYGQQYGDINFSAGYPANQKRLGIALSILDKIKPSSVLDVGCGTGEPLLAMLQAGYEAVGFDFADEMIEEARKNLRESGFDENLVTKNNMEAPINLGMATFEAVTALGSLYYARDFATTLNEVARLVKPGGDIIFSLRNALFSLFSMNKYTAEFFLRSLIPVNSVSLDTQEILGKDMEKYLDIDDVEKIFQTVDDQRIHSTYHNPLTVEGEFLDPAGLRLEKIYYYHFHALPPKFEHLDSQKFREASWRMENPNDWRGMFMASTFVVHAKRIVEAS